MASSGDFQIIHEGTVQDVEKAMKDADKHIAEIGKKSIAETEKKGAD